MISQSRDIASSLPDQMTYREAILWISSRSLAFFTAHAQTDVLDFFDDGPPPAVRDVDKELNRVCEPPLDAELARRALRRALRAGAVVANGRIGGHGPRQNIPAIEWIDLSIGNASSVPELERGVHACGADWLPGNEIGHHYSDLRFERLGVLSSFPEMKTMIEAEAQALVEPPWWAKRFPDEPAQNTFVNDPEMEKEARLHLSRRGDAISEKAVVTELCEMWKEAWGGEPNLDSFSTTRRTYRRETKGKSPPPKNRQQ